MCLVVNSKALPKRAKEDIKCYKNLIPDEKGELRSPIWSGCKWKIGKTKRILNLFPLWFSFFPSLCDIKFVEDGFFHSYESKKPSDFMYEAVIPKGTLYFVGRSGGHYASRKLKIIRKVNGYESNSN
jgi:hypothetical protein